MRSLKPVFSSAVAVALCALLAGGCGGSPVTDDSPDTQSPQSGGLGGKAGEETPSDEEAPTFEEAGTGKITLCHYPPGNPANAHTLSVGAAAWPAHERHGDTLGPCEGSGEPEPDAGCGSEPDAGSGSEPDAGSGSEPDAGAPVCAPVGERCGEEAACCFGLTCGADGFCEPIIG
ncbi:hypothetical protein [Comamonas sp. JC664]|uniref:hypothetical protein n=1 Tax=Comamonas sp. JC664 TaxID=2801917 RepID=UPI001748E558|nr:hypothetical protein [Comamonas sp. JC664]MBL0695425.1 hypothetical protein [Comamonas sp. JC664]GHG87944.1 hypothetical protein GCM10012319_46260 [Comamonas sp. KCTC 72670]